MKKLYYLSVAVSKYTYEGKGLFGQTKKYYGTPLFEKVQMVVEEREVEKTIELMKENLIVLRKKCIAGEEWTFLKNPTLTSIEFNVVKEDCSKKSADWCFKNLTIEQLVQIGLTIINGEDL